MYTAVDFRQAYDDFIAFARQLADNKGLLSGILGVFGLNKGAANDPGHEKFYLEIKAAVEAVCEEHPDSKTAGEIADVLFSARYHYDQEPVSPYMFIAVEGAASELIPYLSREKVTEIYRQYKADNPKSQCVPVQKKVLKALKAAAENACT